MIESYHALSLTMMTDSCCPFFNDFDAQLIEFDGQKDHVHLLVNYPPKIAVSKLVNSLKGVSSRLLRGKGYASIQKALWGQSLWPPSYFADSCGGASIAIIR